MCRKLMVAQRLVDGQQGKVRNRGGGEAGVVAAVQGAVDASLKNGAGGLGRVVFMAVPICDVLACE